MKSNKNCLMNKLVSNFQVYTIKIEHLSEYVKIICTEYVNHKKNDFIGFFVVFVQISPVGKKEDNIVPCVGRIISNSQNGKLVQRR